MSVLVEFNVILCFSGTRFMLSCHMVASHARDYPFFFSKQIVFFSPENNYCFPSSPRVQTIFLSENNYNNIMENYNFISINYKLDSPILKMVKEVNCGMSSMYNNVRDKVKSVNSSSSFFFLIISRIQIMHLATASKVKFFNLLWVDWLVESFHGS